MCCQEGKDSARKNRQLSKVRKRGRAVDIYKMHGGIGENWRSRKLSAHEEGALQLQRQGYPEVEEGRILIKEQLDQQY